MSYEAIDYCFRCKGLVGREKLTLLAMAYHMEKGHCDCCITIPRIEALTGMSINTIRRSIRKLENSGYITKHSKLSAGRNVYTIDGLTNETLVNPNVEHLHEAFDRFWHEYPRKQGKKDAFRAWLKVMPSAELVDRMIANVEARCRSDWTKENMKFIPLAAGWLRGERWEDEVASEEVVINETNKIL